MRALSWWWWLAGFTAFAGFAGTGHAAEPPRWESLTDTVFQHIEQPDPSGPAAFAQDNAGFLWVGTQAGLSRWDGYRFRRYRPQPDGPAGSLPDGIIQVLHTDPAGRMWIATNSAGLLRYDGLTDQFVPAAAGPQGLARDRVQAIADDGERGLWLGTSGGLAHYDPAIDALRRVPVDPPAAEPAAPGAVTALLRDHAGGLWIAVDGRLLHGDGDAGHLVAQPFPGDAGARPGVRALFEDSGRRIWAATADHGVFVIDGPAATPRHFEERHGDRASPLTDEVLSIVEARDGHVWLGTNGGGIVTVDTATWQARRLKHDADSASSLRDNAISALYRDRSGLVWVGSMLQVSRHDPLQTAISAVFGGPGRQEGLSQADIAAVLEGSDGRLWLATGGEGVDIVDPVRGRVTRLRADPAHPDTALAKRRVLSMALAPGGDVYLATKRGLYRADKAGGKVERIRFAQQRSDSALWALLADGDTLWIGALDGLWSLDLRDPRAMATRHPATDRLSDPRITVIDRRPDGLWIGTRGGLNRLDVASGEVEQIVPQAGDRGGLSMPFISTLATDRQGRLWVGTFGGGLQMLDGAARPARFRRIDAAAGLPNSNVNKILLDAIGRLWVSTDEGLAVVDPQTFSVQALGQPQGVAISTYWSNAGVVTSAGELLFGGLGGLTVVRPHDVQRHGQTPPVVITELTVGGLPVWATQGTGPAVSATARPVTVPSASRSLAVEFAALDFSAPGVNRYAYRLQGFDADWIASDASRRLAAYTNLPPGNYTLQLRGSNRDGVWTEPPLSVPVRVLPAWYQTLWFQVAAALAAVAGIGALVQGRTALLRARQRELTRQVAERTTELQDSQRQLQQLAYQDVLTGLPNRRLFTDELRQRLAQAQSDASDVALLLIDLDRFKHINDTRGHDAGDALLVEVAVRLRAVLRETDLVARLGGDEFAIIVPLGSKPIDLDLVCGRIVDSVARAVPFNGHALLTSASIGIALYPDQADQGDTLYKLADTALYAAKAAGRSTWRRHGTAAPAEGAVA